MLIIFSKSSWKKWIEPVSVIQMLQEPVVDSGCYWGVVRGSSV
ncbi:hypothetical protein SynROS8604_03510 [Synechococcus sp. ROS8604]|nr:hypothetical protein SynROS8604_03510 [Synechococcus sp. ROS8604]